MVVKPNSGYTFSNNWSNASSIWLVLLKSVHSLVLPSTRIRLWFVFFIPYKMLEEGFLFVYRLNVNFHVGKHLKITCHTTPAYFYSVKMRD